MSDMEVWLQFSETTALDAEVINGVFWSPYTGVSKEPTAFAVVTYSSETSLLQSCTSYPKKLGLHTFVITSNHACTFSKRKIQLFLCTP